MKHLIAAAFVACAATSASAATITLTFDGVLNETVGVGGTAVEDGFTFTDVNSGAFGTFDALETLSIGSNNIFDVGHTVTLTADAGKLFSVTSFDFASFVPLLADGIFVSGSLGGSVVDFVSIQTSSTIFETSTALSGLFDTVSFVGNAPASTSLLVDNFVLETTIPAVPVPLPVMLLGTGLLGLGIVGRRKARTLDV